MDKRFVFPGLFHQEAERTEFVSATPDDFTHNGSRILTVANPGPPSTPMTLAPIGSNPNANAATFTSNVFNLQPADASFGGVVTTGSQTFAGLKTFSSGISANGLVTGLSAIGATPNINGASVSGGNLSLQPASASFGGVVTTGAQTFAGAKAFDGIYFTSDVGTNHKLLNHYIENSAQCTITSTSGAIPTTVGVTGSGAPTPTPSNAILVVWVRVGRLVSLLIPGLTWANVNPITGFTLTPNMGQVPFPNIFNNGSFTVTNPCLTLDDSGAFVPGLFFMQPFPTTLTIDNVPPAINTVTSGCPCQTITYQCDA